MWSICFYSTMFPSSEPEPTWKVRRIKEMMTCLFNILGFKHLSITNSESSWQPHFLYFWWNLHNNVPQDLRLCRQWSHLSFYEIHVCNRSVSSSLVLGLGLLTGRELVVSVIACYGWDPCQVFFSLHLTTCISSTLLAAAWKEGEPYHSQSSLRNREFCFSRMPDCSCLQMSTFVKAVVDLQQTEGPQGD